MGPSERETCVHVIGLLIILLGLGIGALLVLGTSQITDLTNIHVLGGTLGLPPLALVISGALVVALVWLGWVLLHGGVRRSIRRRREAKESARAAEADRVERERRMQEDFANRERQVAEERRRAAQESSAPLDHGDTRVVEPHPGSTSSGPATGEGHPEGQ